MVAFVLAFQNLGNSYIFLPHPEAYLTLETRVRGNKGTKDIKHSWDMRIFAVSKTGAQKLKLTSQDTL